MTTIAATPEGRIYVYRPTAHGECGAVAYAADGEELACHFSSDLSWFRNDMGLNGPIGLGREKHGKYKAKYPNGYQLFEIIGREAMELLIASGRITGVSFESEAETA